MDPVVTYLSHCASVFQTFGHQFFSVRTLSTHNQNQYPSWGYTAYFIFVFVTLTSQMVTFASFVSSEDKEENLNPKTVLNYVVQHSMYVGLILITCVSLIQSYAVTPLTKKIFLNCIKIAKISQQEFSYTIDHRLIRRKVLSYFISIVLFGLISQILLYFFQTFFGDEKAFLRTCFSILPLIFLKTTAFKFVFYVNMVNYQLATVRKLVLKIPSGAMKAPNHVGFYVKAVKPSKPSGTTKHIRNLRKMFNVICENSELINRSMGMTILSVFTVMVIVITATGEMKSF